MSRHTSLLIAAIAITAMAAVHADIGNITIDFSVSTGTIRQSSGGVNVGSFLLNDTKIDVDGDGTTETLANWTWDTNNILNAGIFYIRSDGFLNQNYQRLANPGFESWVNTSKNFSGSTTMANVPFAWTAESTGSANGSVTQTTDKRSGTYAVNGTNNGSAGIIMIRQTRNVNVNNGYDFAAYVKSANTITVRAKNRDDSSIACSNSTAGTGSFIQIHCYFNTSTLTTNGYQFEIQADAGESFIVDDANLTRNGVEYIAWRDNLSSQRNRTQWAYQNGRVITIVGAYMIDYFANYTTDCYTSTGATDRCDAADLTGFNNAVVDYVNVLTDNGTYLSAIEWECWNEPDGTGFWLPGLATSNSLRDAKYNTMCIAQRTALKAAFPTIVFKGPAITSSEVATSQRMLGNAVRNITFDVCTEHNYVSIASIGSSAVDTQNAILNFTAIANSTYCPAYELNEFNNLNKEVNQNNSDNRGYWETVLIRVRILNLNPLYGDAGYTYGESSNFTGSSDDFSWVSDPRLRNQLRAPYNATKDFNRNHLGGSSVVTSASNTSSVYVVASNKSGSYNFTIVNAGSAPITESIVVSGLSNQIRAAALNGTNFTYNATLGGYTITMENYSAMMFTITADNTAPTVSIVSPTNTTYNTSNISVSITSSDVASNVSSCWYNNGTANVSYSIGSSNSALFNDGSRTIIAYCNDTYGNIGASSSVTFSVDTTAPTVTASANATTGTTAQVNITTNEASNMSFNYGATTSLGTKTNFTDFLTLRSINITGLTANTTYFYNLTLCDNLTNCATTGPFNFSTGYNNTSWTSISFNATPTSGTEPVTVTYSCAAQGGNTPASYNVSFGDSTSSTNASSTHVYNSAGTYIMNCTATDYDGEMISNTTTITVTADTGGGGGGYVPPQTTYETVGVDTLAGKYGDQVTSKTCLIDVAPKTITITDDERAVEVAITNKENVTIKVSSEVEKADGYDEAPGYFDVSRENVELISGGSIEYTVTYTTPLSGSDPVDTQMVLVLSSGSCGAKEVPVQVHMSANADEDGAGETVRAYLRSPVVPGLAALRVWACIGVLWVAITLFRIESLSKTFSESVAKGVGITLSYGLCSALIIVLIKLIGWAAL